MTVFKDENGALRYAITRRARTIAAAPAAVAAAVVALWHQLVLVRVLREELQRLVVLHDAVDDAREGLPRKRAAVLF